jgi:phosphate:Na+ symporter
MRMGWLDVFTLFGGLGLFLFGMKMMGEGLERAAGKGLQRLLNALTGNRLLAMLVGLCITAVIQSSSATTVMVVGFVNAGLLSLGQAIGVIMGANIGTTVTALLLSVRLDFGVIFASIGIILILAGRREKIRQAGNVLMGLGILFIGMNTMSAAMSPLRDWEPFRVLMTGISNPILGVLVGAGITAIIQSSAASIGILQVLAAQGLIGMNGAIFILFGQNIGTCVTALIACAGTNHTAKRAAVVHLLFNIIGTAIFMTLALTLPLANWVASLAPDNIRLQIALSHVFFNVGTAIVLLPLSRVMEKLSWLFVRGVDEPKESMRLNHFDSRLLATPPIAVSQLFKEVNRMGELANRNFKAAMRCFLDEDLTAARQVNDTEDVLDYLNQEVTTYLVEIKSLDLGDRDLHLAGSLFHVINDLERIGDHSINILEIAQKRVDDKVKFTAKAEQELSDMYLRVAHMIDQSLHIFSDQLTDPDILAGIENEEQAVDDLTNALRDHHVERLKNHKCSARNGMLYLDMITNLERIADHANNIAGSVDKPHGASVWIQ